MAPTWSTPRVEDPPDDGFRHAPIGSVGDRQQRRREAAGGGDGVPFVGVEARPPFGHGDREGDERQPLRQVVERARATDAMR
jgi:hypothetical protein